ncbi:VOC family protein [Bacteroidota bacterium]
MKVRYKHTNIVAKNWKLLSDFYSYIFGCEIIFPKRELSGDWLEKGIGVKNAKFEGVHLRLPGHGENGPTLEIFQYSEIDDLEPGPANRRGIGHLAFEVDDVDSFYKRILAKGGKSIGSVTTKKIENIGTITFVYVCDPEGNIIELQNWK